MPWQLWRAGPSRSCHGNSFSVCPGRRRRRRHHGHRHHHHRHRRRHHRHDIVKVRQEGRGPGGSATSVSQGLERALSSVGRAPNFLWGEHKKRSVQFRASPFFFYVWQDGHGTGGSATSVSQGFERPVSSVGRAPDFLWGGHKKRSVQFRAPSFFF